MRAFCVGYLGFTAATALLATGVVAGCGSNGNGGSATAGAGGVAAIGGGPAGGVPAGAGGGGAGCGRNRAGCRRRCAERHACRRSTPRSPALRPSAPAPPRRRCRPASPCRRAPSRGARQLPASPSDLIATVVSPVPDLTLLAKCTDGVSYCVPIDYIATTGSFKTKICTSARRRGGALHFHLRAGPSRRTSRSCPQADCGVSERCAPCYEPRDGSDTKACRQGCDTGPTEPPSCSHRARVEWGSASRKRSYRTT